MKKALITFIIALSLICSFTVCVFAEELVADETIYLAQSKDTAEAQALINEGKTVVTYDELLSSTEEKAEENSAYFDKYTDGTHVEMILIEDIFVPKTIVPSNTGILIRKSLTVTIKFNGFGLYIDNGSNSNYNGIALRNSNAKIRLIGTKGKDLADGGISDTYKKPSGDIANGDFNCANSNLDLFKYAGEFVIAYSGTVYVENLRAYTGRALVNSNSGVGTFEFYDSAIYSGNNYAIDIMGQAGKTLIFENGRCQGLEFHSALTGTHFKNVIVTGAGVVMDCWLPAGNTWIFEDCSINKFSTKTGATSFYLINSTFDENQLYLGKDSAGENYLYSITRPTCTEPGSMYYYYGNNNQVLADVIATKTIDEEYPIQNPALGHEIDIENATGVVWENYFENGMYQGFCARCKADTNEQEGTAKPLFENKGLSHAEYQDTTKSMTQGFKVNTEMLVYLENGYDFGIVATINKDGGEITPALDGTGVVSASFVKAGYSIFHVKVTNIPEANKDTKIVFCAYLVNGGKTYYLNNGTTAETIVGLDYTTVSK